MLFLSQFSIIGCSFQATKPAPVYSLHQTRFPRFEKGSIDSATYKVKTGDTLYSIAWGADKDFRVIARLNKLDSDFTIYPGQVLRLVAIKPKTRTVTQKSSKNSSHNAKVKKTKIVKKQEDKKEVSISRKPPNSEQKKLDSGHNNSYAVTTGKQVVNSVIHKSEQILPSKVSRWIWPANGRLIGTFSNSEQGNKGIKIAGNRGDIIKTAADGRVVYAGSALRGYGNLVIIKHSDDYLSAYAHADKILVKEKQQVSAGQTVALMGSSGTNQVMLHFEIRYLGKSVNPLSYLPKR
ncbi:peptidase M23B [Shewanella mangrovi]|uniref:Peptidase M23B n=1 Tax=Shewanella mangrovi TaxID=1515746 RepID=A0A094LSS1_9GAMM|nr:peptidoglycan DD-metalloendopeptidase family protein [Shewanella mangrovi]KFZ38233.1 peptidase M23B [Shewanella mangrovi]